ncbi:hypothetical protein BJ742DRAFT_797219 [Cladochytrium replicatum]|nr:hypothetical protein BJ742DRAFT_797219 [Cladochytrium replicatum]
MPTKHPWQLAAGLEPDSSEGSDLPPSYPSNNLPLERLEDLLSRLVPLPPPSTSSHSQAGLRTQQLYIAQLGFSPSKPAEECSVSEGDVIYVDSISPVRPGFVLGYNVTEEGTTPKGEPKCIPVACITGMHEIDASPARTATTRESASQARHLSRGTTVTSHQSAGDRRSWKTGESRPYTRPEPAPPSRQTAESPARRSERSEAVVSPETHLTRTESPNGQKQKGFNLTRVHTVLIVGGMLALALIGLIVGVVVGRQTASSADPNPSNGSNQPSSGTTTSAAPEITAVPSSCDPAARENYLCTGGKLYTCNSSSKAWSALNGGCAAEAVARTNVSLPTISIAEVCVNGQGGFVSLPAQFYGQNVCPCLSAKISYCGGASLYKCNPGKWFVYKNCTEFSQTCVTVSATKAKCSNDPDDEDS